MSGRGPDPARKLAWTVLREVAERDAYANLLLPRLLRESRLDARDRAFVTELAYGTLRAQGTLDHVIALASSRPLDGIDPPVLDGLRLGAYQLLRTRIPPHAAVAETVDLVRGTAGEGASRFANAVLRRVAERAGGDDPLGLSTTDDEVERIALETSHPTWIVEAYAEALGGLERARPALRADDERPVTHLVARRIERDELIADIPGASAGPWSPHAVHLTEGGDPGTVEAVRDGRAAVQDEGSQLVALALAAADSPRGPTVDLCAGPGGKSGLLAAVLPGTPLLALERQPHRAALVASVVPGRVVVSDGRRPPLAPASVARVLVDAPCSGLGALRRRPEARWRRRPADVDRLVPLQRDLLAAGLRLLAPGGVLVYATCSPHLAETAQVVASTPADPIDVRTLLPGVTGLGDGPTVQLWPHRHGTDAMFIAAFRAPGVS